MRVNVPKSWLDWEAPKECKRTLRPVDTDEERRRCFGAQSAKAYPFTCRKCSLCFNKDYPLEDKVDKEILDDMYQRERKSGTGGLKPVAPRLGKKAATEAAKSHARQGALFGRAGLEARIARDRKNNDRES